MFFRLLPYRMPCGHSLGGSCAFKADLFNLDLLVFLHRTSTLPFSHRTIATMPKVKKKNAAVSQEALHKIVKMYSQDQWLVSIWRNLSAEGVRLGFINPSDLNEFEVLPKDRVGKMDAELVSCSLCHGKIYADCRYSTSAY